MGLNTATQDVISMLRVPDAWATLNMRFKTPTSFSARFDTRGASLGPIGRPGRTACHGAPAPDPWRLSRSCCI